MAAFSIHARVAEQFRARPDATAVTSPHGDLTYAEVWSLSSTIAGRLGRPVGRTAQRRRGDAARPDPSSRTDRDDVA
jgi:non-ribosomal peptide synthetase component F